MPTEKHDTSSKQRMSNGRSRLSLANDKAIKKYIPSGFDRYHVYSKFKHDVTIAREIGCMRRKIQKESKECLEPFIK